LDISYGCSHKINNQKIDSIFDLRDDTLDCFQIFIFFFIIYIFIVI